MTVHWLIFQKMKSIYKQLVNEGGEVSIRDTQINIHILSDREKRIKRTDYCRSDENERGKAHP